MGIGSFLENAGNNLTGGIFSSPNQAPGAAGVPQGGPPDPSRLVRDPTTGQMVDPATGVRYTSTGDINTPYATVVNPNTATQVSGANANAAKILSDLGTAQKQQDTAYQGQTQQVQDLNKVINGAAPSAAAMQLEQSLGAIQRQQQAAASGVGGQNAFAARQAAQANIGNADIGAAQAAATQRATETASANAQKAGILSNIASGGNARAGTDTGAATAFSGQALNGQEDLEKINNAAGTANANAANSQRGAILNDIAGGATKAAGG